MTVLVGMKLVAHPEKVTVRILPPELGVIDERCVVRTGHGSNRVHVNIEPGTAIRGLAGKYGTGGLEHRDCAEIRDHARQLIQVRLEVGWRNVVQIAAIVHPDHDQDDVRFELRHPPVKAFEQTARIVTADGRVDDDIHGAGQFEPQSLAEQFNVVTPTVGVPGPMGDAVSVEEPFSRLRLVDE